MRENATIVKAVEAGQWDRVIDYVNKRGLRQPERVLHPRKTAQEPLPWIGASVCGRFLEKIFGLIPRFKSKDELLEEEFAKFVADYKPDEAEAIPAIKTYFKAYVTSDQSARTSSRAGHFTDLATNPMFSTSDYRAVPEKYRALIPEYIKDYVSLNQFAA